jgi:hypothetical protein
MNRKPVGEFFLVTLIFAVIALGAPMTAMANDGSGTVIIDGQSFSYLRDGQFLHVDGQTYVISQIGTTVSSSTIGGPRSGSASIVPNLTPEQAAAYPNSTQEGRAASAKFDADLKASEAKWNAELNSSAPKTSPANERYFKTTTVHSPILSCYRSSERHLLYSSHRLV